MILTYCKGCFVYNRIKLW